MSNVVDGEESDSAPVLPGVPQGTVLDLLLFLIYINDMTSQVSPGTCIRLFADDWLVYRAMNSTQDHWAPSQYAKRRLFVRSREVSKPRDWYFKLSYRFEIWQAHRQQCCRSACQISERLDNSKYKSRGFETSRDLTKRHLFGYWDGALVVLQRDLLHLQAWAELWSMRFNPSKCYIMHTSRGQPSAKLYELCSVILQSVPSAKYLGVAIRSDLQCSEHLNNIAARANSTLHFIHRNLKYCPQSTRETAYCSLVRSTLEYCSGTWDPHLQKGITTLEKVNRRAVWVGGL